MDRVTVPEAAARLGVSENALRKRIQRDTIEWARDEEGRIYVYLSEAMTEQADGYAADQAGDQSQLVESMQDQIDYLRDLLKTRDQELAEMRRLLAGALERIPELEAPSEARDSSPEAASERGARGDASESSQEPAQRRSWLLRWFGF
jgi:hypothetical protein